MTRHRRIALIGAVLILGGNVVALIGVAYNRSGDPDAVIELSERELTRPYNFLAAKENSGLALNLIWRSGQEDHRLPGLFSGGWATPQLMQEQLKALGFDVDVDPHDVDAVRRISKALPRKGYVVLEFNGSRYLAALQASEAAFEKAKDELAAKPDDKALQLAASLAQNRRDQEREKSTRLFAIGVGPDPAALRSRYQDRGRYLILPCRVRLSGASPPFSGYIEPTNTEVNVPLDLRGAIAGEGGAPPSHYAIRLAIGKRGEPWIMEAKAE